MGKAAPAASTALSSSGIGASSPSRIFGSASTLSVVSEVGKAHLLGWASFFSASSAPRRTSLQRHITVLTSFSSSPRVMASRASLPQSHAAAHLLGWASFLSSRLALVPAKPKPHFVTSSRRSRICAASSKLALVPAKPKPHRTESAVPA